MSRPTMNIAEAIKPSAKLNLKICQENLSQRRSPVMKYTPTPTTMEMRTRPASKRMTSISVIKRLVPTVG